MKGLVFQDVEVKQATLLFKFDVAAFLSEAYLETNPTSTMELFAKVLLQKHSIVDVGLGSKYASVTYSLMLIY